MPLAASLGLTRVTVGAVASVAPAVVQVALVLTTRLLASVADSITLYVAPLSSAADGAKVLESANGLLQVPPCVAHSGVWPPPAYTKHGEPVPESCSSEKPVCASV